MQIEKRLGIRPCNIPMEKKGLSQEAKEMMEEKEC